MKKVALTGNIGCGKSTVGYILRQLGAFVVDADKIIHTFYRKGHRVYDTLLKLFGKEIESAEGVINRKKLADIVFSDKEKLRKLEEITHSELYKELENIFKKCKKEVVFVEASLLIEKGTYRNYDITVVVYAPYKICKERMLKKGFSEKDFDRRWKNQMPIEQKIKFADYVIDNSNGLEKTKQLVKDVYESIKRDP